MNTNFSLKFVRTSLAVMAIILIIFTTACSTLVLVMGRSKVYETDKSRGLRYNVPTRLEYKTNRFNEQVELLWADAKKPTDKVIFYLHGNIGRIPRLIEEMTDFANVVSPSYPGYATSEGLPGTDRIYDTVDLTMAWLVVEKGYKPENITIIGHSLGGSPAVYAAVKYPEVGKVVLVNTFYSIQAMCEKDYSILCSLTGGVLNTASYAPITKAKIRQFHNPNDEYIPYAQGQKLFQLLGSQDKKFMDIAGNPNNPKEQHGYFKVADALKD